MWFMIWNMTDFVRFYDTNSWNLLLTHGRLVCEKRDIRSGGCGTKCSCGFLAFLISENTSHCWYDMRRGTKFSVKCHSSLTNCIFFLIYKIYNGHRQHAPLSSLQIHRRRLSFDFMSSCQPFSLSLSLLAGLRLISRDMIYDIKIGAIPSLMRIASDGWISLRQNA